MAEQESSGRRWASGPARSRAAARGRRPSRRPAGPRATAASAAPTSGSPRRAPRTPGCPGSGMALSPDGDMVYAKLANFAYSNLLQNLQFLVGSFTAVSKPIFAGKHAFCSIFQAQSTRFAPFCTAPNRTFYQNIDFKTSNFHEIPDELLQLLHKSANTSQI